MQRNHKCCGKTGEGKPCKREARKYVAGAWYCWSHAPADYLDQYDAVEEAEIEDDGINPFTRGNPFGERE